MIKVGDKITTFFSGQPDSKSTVLEIFPYTGLYKESFDCVLRLTAPRTAAGYMDMAANSSDEKSLNI